MFPCERCGSCCRRIADVFIAKDLVLPSGACKFFDEEKNLCRIYSTRPIFCNVDAYYDKYLSQTVSREEFYRQNKEACRELRTRAARPRSESEPVSRRIISLDEMPSNIRERAEE